MKFVSVIIGLLGGALLGALIGFVVQSVTNQVGWSLTLGAGGACAGAYFAALRASSGKYVWRSRPAPAPVEAGGDARSA